MATDPLENRNSLIEFVINVLNVGFNNMYAFILKALNSLLQILDHRKFLFAIIDRESMTSLKVLLNFRLIEYFLFLPFILSIAVIFV